MTYLTDTARILRSHGIDWDQIVSVADQTNLLDSYSRFNNFMVLSGRRPLELSPDELSQIRYERESSDVDGIRKNIRELPWNELTEAEKQYIRNRDIAII